MYFEICLAKDGSYYWHLKAGNHEIVATSEMYTSKAACRKTIDSIKNHGIDAQTPVHDRTL
ncbi:hypothetical protein ABB02_00953 [Clostridiaceae bacterium JG1575]|nr:hypothetical protein ABB02_00953 [Clostridiaceae bacterium JG1575]